MSRVKGIEQSPCSVVMVRPHHFSSNPETANDNAFQKLYSNLTASKLAKKALMEVTHVANTLTQHGIQVHLFDDTLIGTPDSVFPNNWFSTHNDGTLVLYPMYCKNRRKERRETIINAVKEDFNVSREIDYSSYEHDSLFLEGTGSLVLDHRERIAYAAKSNRTDATMLDKFCHDMGFEALMFRAVDSQGTSIYHTNVMMNIATNFVLIGTDTIVDKEQRKKVVETLVGSGKEIVHLSNEQVYRFAANAFEMESPNGKILAMSKTGYQELTSQQKQVIEKYSQIVVLDVPTIELAGGSVRCMLAGIHLTPAS